MPSTSIHLPVLLIFSKNNHAFVCTCICVRLICTCTRYVYMFDTYVYIMCYVCIHIFFMLLYVRISIYI